MISLRISPIRDSVQLPRIRAINDAESGVRRGSSGASDLENRNE